MAIVARISKLFFSLRVRLVLLVALALVPVLTLYLINGSAERRVAERHAEEDALRLAHSVSARERQLFEGANQLLLAVAQMPEMRSGTQARRDTLLATLLEESPIYFNIGVIGADGIVTGSALPFNGVVNLSDRSYFRRAVETRRFSVGDYQIGRITGKASVNFGFPMFDENDELQIVVFAAMDLSWLRRMAMLADPPVGTVLTLIDGNGTILARTVEPEEWVGKKINMTADLRDVMVNGEGVTVLTDVDEIERLCAVAPLSRGGTGNVYLTVGIPTSTVFVGLDETSFWRIFALTLVCLLSLVGAWFGGHAFISRRLHTLVNVASRLGDGDLSARACDKMKYGRDEIGELARVFDGMAEAMNYRESELQKTQLELMSAVDETIEGWARALERRDSDTQGHTRRVADLAVRLSHAMAVPEEQIVHIRRGALLHDIGKMGIPDSILLKPGPLTDDEWEVMRRHPTYAYEWLSHIALFKPALEIPYGHHERWDGSGYPRGLVGVQIPLAARIFAVIDVYDGVTSDRPYRDAWSVEQALHYIRAGSDTFFDPRVVEAFLELVTSAPSEAAIAYQPGSGDGKNKVETADSEWTLELTEVRD